MEGQYSHVMNIQKYYRWFMVSLLPHTQQTLLSSYPSQDIKNIKNNIIL